MELNTIPNEGPPTPSASVVLLRDGRDGLEVFLQRRHGRSQVHGGAYVFPGGKAEDGDRAWAARLDRSAAELHALLGEPELAPDHAAGLFVTAIRELFEEAGLLLADVSPETARTHWAALRAGTPFDALPGALDLRLSASVLQPWSRWITPVLGTVNRRRFDTRFFLATVPAGQEPTHDDHEAVESLWLAPATALRQYWEGAIDLASPQIMSLAHLARQRDAASVLAQARRGPPPCIRPEAQDVEGVRVICYPGDPSHSQGERILPGPTRLSWRDGRFVPDGGLAILLGD
jgi:8-oxo-dGTP pyrophosphatase MutT (NUDIX family)